MIMATFHEDEHPALPSWNQHPAEYASIHNVKVRKPGSAYKHRQSLSSNGDSESVKSYSEALKLNKTPNGQKPLPQRTAVYPKPTELAQAIANYENEKLLSESRTQNILLDPRMVHSITKGYSPRNVPLQPRVDTRRSYSAVLKLSTNQIAQKDVGPEVRDPQHQAPDKTAIRSEVKRSHDNNTDGKFLNRCCSNNVLLEGCIIQSVMKQRGLSIFANPDELKPRIKFASPHGDPFVVLNVTREWVAQLRTTGSDIPAWAADNGINLKALRTIESQVQDIYHAYKKSHPRAPELNFRANIPAMTNSLLNLLIKHYAHDICINTRHDALGYRRVSDEQLIILDQVSIFGIYSSAPKYLLPLVISSKPIVARCIGGRQVLMANPKPQFCGNFALAVPDDLVKHLLKECYVVGCEKELNSLALLVIQDIGFKTTELFAAEWGSLKSGATAGILQITGLSSLVAADLDPSNNSIRLFCNEQYHNTISAFLMSEIEDIRTKLLKGSIILPPYGPTSKSTCSMAVGQGFMCNEFLLGGESMTAVVKAIPGVDITWGEVEHKLSKYLQGATFHERPLTDIREDILGAIRTKTTDDMQKILNARLFQSAPFGLIPHSAVDYFQESLYYFRDNLNVVLQWKVNSEDSLAGVTDADIAFVRATVCQLLADLSEDKVIVHVLSDEVRHHSKLHCQILLSSRGTSMKGLELIRDFVSQNASVSIDNLDVVDNHMRSFKLIMKNELFQVIEKPLTAKLENFRLSRLYQATYSLSHTNKGTVCLSLTVATHYTCTEIITRLEETLKGQFVNLSDVGMAHLKSFEGGLIVQSLMRQTETCFIVPPLREGVTIHGTRAARKQCEALLKAHITSVQDYMGPSKFTTIRPKDDGLPNDILITMVDEMQYVFNSNLVIVKSTPEQSYENILKSLIQDYHRIKQGMHTSQDYGVSKTMKIESTPTCSCCFLEFEQDGKYYVLEGCGHIYCMECLHLQVTDCIRTTTFPVVCAHDNQTFSAYDFINITEKLHITNAMKLIEASIRHFVKCNPSTHKFCIRPNCPGVGRIMQSDGGDFTHCSVCSKKACPLCLGNYHKFMTCAQAAEYNLSLNLWMSQNPDTHKNCPHCRIGIEKTGGCNHVRCAACFKHICWNCLKYYNTSRDCYQHLNSVHGGHGLW